MKLKDFINEMSLPYIDNAEVARKKILEIAPLVNSGNVKGDYIGILDACLRAIQNATNPEAYSREIKMALNAKKALVSHRNTLSNAQVQHTSVKPTNSFGK